MQPEIATRAMYELQYVEIDMSLQIIFFIILYVFNFNHNAF